MKVQFRSSLFVGFKAHMIMNGLEKLKSMTMCLPLLSHYSY